MGNCVIAPVNEAHLISGPRGTRVCIGEAGFQIWCIERDDVLMLDMMTIQLTSKSAETTKGVPITVTSTAQVKVNALTPTGENSSGKYNMEAIKLAAQHFLGSSPEEMVNALQRTLEGHQRQILGTLTVEEIYKDRAAFSAKVREHVMEDLAGMGFSIVSYTVVEIADDQGYMKSLGQTQVALVRREAAEGTSRNESEAKKKVAQFTSDADISSANAIREAHVSVNLQKEMEAESDTKLLLRKAEFARQVNVKNAEAEAASRIEGARQNQAVIREERQQKLVEAEVNLKITDAEIEKQQKEKEGESKARLMAQANDADGIRVLARAEADRIRLIGEAKADSIRADGKAQADVLRERALAFKDYEEAALVEMIINQLPAVAREIAQPLSKTEKMVFISSDGSSGSKLTGDVINIVAQMPHAVKSLTGFDMTEALTRLSEGRNDQKQANKREQLAQI